MFCEDRMLPDLLIVDDSLAIRKILQRTLRQAGFDLGSVYEAGDGVEALEVLKKSKVGLILTDVNMPNMDGLEFLGKVKASDEWKDLPVFVVSTEGGQSKVIEAVRLGAAGYLRKPFTADQIKGRLEKYLG
jgi:two-component system, chemotaxis family, chemotaxis protein CheY